ncbi:uncharacterized protein LOC143287329 [Babylonia areolata]|uniref:uncharacterized protein LOC143287329 n=1 Tax=Babylonia areolata TaxID=304850 RepID=UPI003FCFAA69
MSATVCQCVLLLAACALMGVSAASSLQERMENDPRAALAQRLQPFQAPLTSEQQQMNKILSLLLDMTYEMYRELGASPQALKELHHKRGYIQTCYFQAVSCY